MYKVNRFISLQTNSFRVFFDNNLKYCNARLPWFVNHVFELSVNCELKDWNKWNIFVMFINTLNNENSVTLSYQK